MRTDQLTGPTGVLVRPDEPAGTGVLVLLGSSGRIDAERAALLARHGALACSIRWFGDPGQPPGACEVPLETFFGALDRLAPECDRLAIVGLSYGAEAALLIGAHDPRVSAVVALAPSAVVWANSGPGFDGLSAPPRSKWTLGGRALPFVPYDPDWEPSDSPPSFRGLYALSLRTFVERVEAATIPVERIDGTVICVAGENDAVWDSADHAARIADRRAAHGLEAIVVTHPGAGHCAVLPGEGPPVPRPELARGGDPRSDAELGARAWPHVVAALKLRA